MTRMTKSPETLVAVANTAASGSAFVSSDTSRLADSGPSVTWRAGISTTTANG